MEQQFTNEILSALTERLVAEGVITKDQLAVARMTKRTLGGSVAQILIKKGFVTEVTFRNFLTSRLSLEEMSLAELPIDPAVVKLVPFSVAQRYHFVPLYRTDDVLTIAVSDPLSLFAIVDQKGLLNCSIHPVLAMQEQIDAAIQMHYHGGGESSVVEESVHVVGQRETGDDNNEREKLEELAARDRVVATVNNILGKAVRRRASDIHIEPMIKEVRVRFRMDGLLQEITVLPNALHLPIVSRLKVLSGMDIAERRIPQDGRVRLRVQDQTVDLRLSTYPTMFGEKVVIRLLMKSGLLTLESLGLSPTDKQVFADLIARPHGIFLVTGPTGSGKSSTLYAALQRLNSQERNIVSVEDPVENEIQGVNQAQVNVRSGMTFAAALRSILRQDPDIIMVGEIRDSETADMAVRAALTGHLVFSTLHTNTAAGAIERLADMGVERFLIGSALLGVMAQRLVRRTCPHCKEALPVDEVARKFIGDPEWNGPLYRGKGCQECRMTGAMGRIGIFELMTVDAEVRKRIAGGASEEELRDLERQREGFTDMMMDGIAKVKAGITTIDEVIRVTKED